MSKRRQTSRPVVGVTTDRHRSDGVEEERVRVRYLEALRQSAKVVPLLIPSDGTLDEIAILMGRLDGLLLTGAASNVDPGLYGGAPAAPETLDFARDRTTMAAIRFALAAGLPLLGICRGLQELNVALGGSLSADISGGEGRLAHVEDLRLPRDAQYLPVHEVQAQGQGQIAQCIRQLDAENNVRVNSLHAQGIERLAPDLAIDALCNDGTIEAVSVKNAKGFAAAVQWHPEWFHAQDRLSAAIFGRFGAACRQYQSSKACLS